MKTIVILSIGIILSSSCAKESLIPERQSSLAASELWDFYAKFEFDAEKRGLNIDLQSFQISGEIEESEEAGVAGRCQYGSIINHHVTVDASFWLKASNSSKEMVVFHELGHYVPFRGHGESQNNLGRCLSNMRSGSGPCKNDYSEKTGTAYLDELFYNK